MSKIVKKMKIMQPDGTLSDYVSIGAEAENINVDGESVEIKLGKKPYYYNTVADMKTDTKLKAGDMAVTLGYYSINDGGKIECKIRIKTNEDIIDEMSIISIQNQNLVAELMIDDIINIKQLGARSQFQNIKYDIKNYIDKYLDLQTKYDKRFKLYIPAGVWYTSGNYLHHKLGFSIIGDASFPGFDGRANGTIITTYNNNQDYIFRLGSSAHICHNWNIENIVFSSADINYTNGNYYFGSLKNVTKALEIHYGEYGISDNLFFMHIKGNCLTINSCWENYFKLLNFRTVTNENGSIIDFETFDTTLGNANVTANTFEKIMFEQFHGNLINFKNNCSVYNNHFGVINIEDRKFETDGTVYTSFTDEILATWDDTDCTHYSLFNFEESGNMGENVIDSIELNNYSSKYYTYDNTKYVYDTIIKYADRCVCNNIFNNINLNGMKKDCKVIYLPSTITVNGGSSRQFNTFNNFGTDSNKNFIFDVQGLNDINVSDNAYLYGTNNIYTSSKQSFDIYKLGSWIPCYKAKSKRFLSSGVGQLYYDNESMNPLQLVVKPRTDNTDRSILMTVVNPNKKLYIRAKIPNENQSKINVTNKTVNENIVYTFNGTGQYQIYEIELTNIWNVGDIIYITLAGSSTEQRLMSLDSYISN